MNNQDLDNFCKSKYVDISTFQNLTQQESQAAQQIDSFLDKSGDLEVITGEQGYRTAIACNGIGGKAPSVFYFEVQMLPPKTPLPYLNIKPAARIGLCQMDIQHVDKPLGSNKLSYCYSSTGKVINDSRNVGQNADFCKYYQNHL